MYKFLKSAAAGLAAAGLLISVPAQATGSPSAEKLRRLNIMLMVTALRCRTTADNFQSDFAAFEKAHMIALNGAANQLKRGLVGQYGAAGANRALDRLSTGMANQYGQGHPWLGCADLKSVTKSLALMRGPAALEEAADQLLSSQGAGPELAFVRR